MNGLLEKQAMDKLENLQKKFDVSTRVLFFTTMCDCTRQCYGDCEGECQSCTGGIYGNY